MKQGQPQRQQFHSMTVMIEEWPARHTGNKGAQCYSLLDVPSRIERYAEDSSLLLTHTFL